MLTPIFVGIEGARRALAEIGIDLSARQLKRAADPDPYGKRKLPFFVDPIDKRLKIDKHVLLAIYTQCQVDAESNAKITRHAPQKGLEPGL